MANGQLTNKQRRFVAEYMIDCNATRAAIRAGYSSHTADVQGSRLLSKKAVAESVAAGQRDVSDRLGITTTRLIDHLVDVASIPQEVPPLDKLRALRRLCDHLGFWPKTEADAVRNRALMGEARTMLALLGLISETPEARAASAAMLDLVSLDWRSVADSGLVGGVVDRDSAEVRAWRDTVLERDGRACVRCAATENLHAHHIVRWADEPWLRVVVDNGVTLCQPCHAAEHSLNG